MLVSLALGVGACTTIFSWINGILLQPFPAVASSGKYMVLASRTPSGTLAPLSYAAYVDIREAAPVFDNLVAVGVTLNALNLGAEQNVSQVERVFANFVSGTTSTPWASALKQAVDFVTTKIAYLVVIRLSSSVTDSGNGASAAWRTWSGERYI